MFPLHDKIGHLEADFTFDDFGIEGEGIVHCCHCANCGAEIEYRVPLEKEGDQDQ